MQGARIDSLLKAVESLQKEDQREKQVARGNRIQQTYLDIVTKISDKDNAKMSAEIFALLKALEVGYTLDLCDEIVRRRVMVWLLLLRLRLRLRLILLVQGRSSVNHMQASLSVCVSDKNRTCLHSSAMERAREMRSHLR